MKDEVENTSYFLEHVFVIGPILVRSGIRFELCIKHSIHVFSEITRFSTELYPSKLSRNIHARINRTVFVF